MTVDLRRMGDISFNPNRIRIRIDFTAIRIQGFYVAHKRAVFTAVVNVC